MNIYKVTRISEHGYDEYSSFICYAENEEQAINLDPCSVYIYDHLFEEAKFIDWDDETLTSLYYFGWVTSKDDLTVIELGTSESETVGIILASYHAG